MRDWDKEAGEIFAYAEQRGMIVLKLEETEDTIECEFTTTLLHGYPARMRYTLTMDNGRVPEWATAVTTIKELIDLCAQRLA